MKLKNIKIKNLLLNLFVTLLYPFAKAYKSNNFATTFSDTCLVIGFIMGILGIVNSSFLHGDFDITGFITQRSLSKTKQDFDIYMENQKDKRKDSFNYPLLCCFILIIISYIASLFS